MSDNPSGESSMDKSDREALAAEVKRLVGDLAFAVSMQHEEPGAESDARRISAGAKLIAAIDRLAASAQAQQAGELEQALYRAREHVGAA